MVRAKYSDGRVEDVTRWVKYSSNNEGVASVDDYGRVKMNGPGEAAVTLWYSSRVLYSRLTRSVSQPDRIRRLHQISAAQLYRRSGAGQAEEAEHRAIGRMLTIPLSFAARIWMLPESCPAPKKWKHFLADKSPQTNASALIDRLIARDEFVDYWAYKWSDLLLVSSKRLNSTAMWTFYDWIRESVKEDKPWNQFANEIFTSSGSSRQNGALNYFVLHKDPIDLAETSTEAFLGQRITCARCHNHPLEKWTQTQYYEMVNLFTRVGIKNGSEPGENVVFAKTSGDIMHPRLLKPLPPTPLDGKSIPLDSPDRPAYRV